jgi:hypothetical protein
MLCHKCHQREATVHLTFISGEKMQKKDLCEVCAPTKEQIKQDPSTVLGAYWPQGWPKPKPKNIISSGSDSDESA